MCGAIFHEKKKPQRRLEQGEKDQEGSLPSHTKVARNGGEMKWSGRKIDATYSMALATFNPSLRLKPEGTRLMPILFGK